MKAIEKYKVNDIKVKSYDDREVIVTLKKDINQNEYMKIGKYWVRNFSVPTIKEIDINNFYYDINLQEIIQNELENTRLKNELLEKDLFNRYRNFLIVSDGYGFENHKLFDSIRSDVCIIATNQAARLWESKRLPDFFLINNPDPSCMVAMPVRIFPKLIASRKTHNKFLRSYPNGLHFYDAVPDGYYKSPFNDTSEIHIDDYRNPICAAIGLSFKFGQGNLFLAFCSPAYKNKKDGMVDLGDNLHNYPAQRTADEIIDANLFFYKFGRPRFDIFYTGYKNCFKFSKYLEVENFVGLLK